MFYTVTAASLPEIVATATDSSGNVGTGTAGLCVIDRNDDVFDRRIAKVVDADGAGPQAAETTYTVYDGDHAWADFDEAGSVVARYLFGDRIDEILARWRPGEGTAWYLTDRLGTIRDIVDSAGILIDHIDYDSFGNVIFESNPAAGDRFKFTGREFDTETDVGTLTLGVLSCTAFPTSQLAQGVFLLISETFYLAITEASGTDVAIAILAHSFGIAGGGGLSRYFARSQGVITVAGDGNRSLGRGVREFLVGNDGFATSPGPRRSPRPIDSSRPTHAAPDHDATGFNQAKAWEQAPETVEARFNQPLVDASGNQVSNLRPDAQRIRETTDGQRKVDVTEVRSRTQSVEQMNTKIQKYKEMLGDQAGEIRWIEPTPGATRNP